MTTKERLLEAIERTPEPILAIVLDFLEFLRTRTPEPQPLTNHLPTQNLSFRQLAGILHEPGRPTVSLEAMDEAIMQGVLESL